MDAAWRGLATETAFIDPMTVVLRCNVLLVMPLSALIRVHLRFQD